MEKMNEMERDDLVAPPRKGGFFGKLIALLLGFILGVVGGIGGIGYAGYYAATQIQIQQGVDYLNTYAGLNIDYTQFVNGKYGEATIADLIGEVANAVTEIANGNGSLNTLNEISPYVAKLILGEAGSEDDNGLISKLQALGLEVDGETLMNLILVKPSGVSDKNPDVYLTDYLLDSATSIEVVKVLEMVNVEVNDMLALICYDGDRALTIGELMTMDMFAKLSNIPLETVLKPTPGNVIMMRRS